MKKKIKEAYVKSLNSMPAKDSGPKEFTLSDMDRCFERGYQRACQDFIAYKYK